MVNQNSESSSRVDDLERRHVEGSQMVWPQPKLLTHLLFRLIMQILTNLKFRGKYFTVINGNALMSDHPEHLFYLWAHIWLTQRIHLQSTCTSSIITPIKVFSFFFCSESPEIGNKGLPPGFQWEPAPYLQGQLSIPHQLEWYVLLDQTCFMENRSTKAMLMIHHVLKA